MLHLPTFALDHDMVYTVMLRRAPLMVLLLVGLLSGCRTYGGYGTEEASLEEMAQAIDTYENLLAQARSILAALEEQAETDPAVDPFVEQFEAIVIGHTVLLEEQKEHLRALTGSSDYRKISRVLGAVLAEQKLTQRQYGEVIKNALHPPDSTAELVRGHVAPLGRYYVVPPYYEKVRQGRLGTFSQLEVGRRSESRAESPDSL